jgi:hypothetical protein
MKSIAAILMALVVAAPVAAQSIIPRERPATADREGKFKGDLARKTMDQFAACVLDRRRKSVMQALEMPSDSPEQNEIFGKLVRTDCIDSADLSFNGPAFRGSLYKALVRKEFGRKEVFKAPATDATPEQATPQEVGTTASGEAGRLRFASCVVHKDPASARDAILATAGSDKETEAMTALGNVYGQCLYQDETLRVSKGALIGLLAEAYYRNASAATENPAAR